MSTRYKKPTCWVRSIVFVSLMAIFASNKAFAAVSEYFAGTTNVANATVRINETVGETNSDGSFGFHVARADQYAISVSKPGYALVSIIEKFPNKNLVFTLQKAELISISIADHSKGITIKDSHNTNIQLPANAFGKVNEPINAYIYTYDLANEAMPGDMSAVNSKGETTYLLSAGVFWAEFVGASSGKKYELATSATISVPTPANKENEVPKLWSFDETTGKWIEEGSARNSNGRLEGKVRHFSAWNFDWEKQKPACVKIELTKSLFETYDIGGSPQTVQIKAVVTSPSGVVNTRLLTENNNPGSFPWLAAIYNIPSNSTVELLVKNPSSGTFVSLGTVNSGTPWGGTGIPPHPYDVCNGNITLNPPSLSVTLDKFTANAANGKIIINWTTGTETNNAGFILWRATPIDGQCTTNPYNYKNVKQVQPLVYSKAKDGVLGASYSEEDNNVEPKVTYCYGLEDIDYDGKRTFHIDQIISATLN
jgi:hypothetical protein